MLENNLHASEFGWAALAVCAPGLITERQRMRASYYDANSDETHSGYVKSVAGWLCVQIFANWLYYS
jgi:hypothetical protein